MIQTDHLISTRRPDLSNDKQKQKKKKKKEKRTCRIMNVAVPADHRIKSKESEKKDKYLDLAKELKKLWNVKVTVIPIVIGALCTVIKGLVSTGTEGLGNKRRSGTHRNSSNVKISLNTVKSPRDLRRLAVTQNPVRNHWLTPV